MDKTVVELFAGVGGFRIGLNEVSLSKNGKVIEKDNFTFVWANQWEPSTKVQHAFECYTARFGIENVSNQDITLVDKNSIPNHSLLVGGFPCQDYSVARSLSNEKGIEGKKGVLWWEINKILEIKRPPFVLLENVDRLLKSPSKQRGRDFAIMLRCFNDLGYSVEWRVINAAEYGHVQRRRRTFIFAFHRTTKYYQKMTSFNAIDIINEKGIFAKKFPIKTVDKIDKINDISKSKFNSLIELSNTYTGIFNNSGYLFDGIAYHTKVTPVNIKPKNLGSIILNNAVENEFYITNLDKFKYLKGDKKIDRVSKLGIKYRYSEGKMAFPDDLNKPARTMLTSEGSINRSTHVIQDITGKYRILTPIETERLNEFPDNWTNTGMSTKRRYFMMGNALVTGIIKKIGKEIKHIIENE